MSILDEDVQASATEAGTNFFGMELPLIISLVLFWSFIICTAIWALTYYSSQKFTADTKDEEIYSPGVISFSSLGLNGHAEEESVSPLTLESADAQRVSEVTERATQELLAAEAQQGDDRLARLAPVETMSSWFAAEPTAMMADAENEGPQQHSSGCAVVKRTKGAVISEPDWGKSS